MSELIRDLLSEGYEARRQGNEQEALAAFARAAASSRAAANPSLLAEALTAAAYTERNLENVSGALDNYGSAAKVYRHLDEPLKLAHTLRHVADILREHGRLEESNRNYEEALAIYRGCPGVPTLDMANALRGFALLKESLREAGIAKALWEEAGELYEAVGVQAGAEESGRRVLLLGDETGA